MNNSKKLATWFLFFTAIVFFIFSAMSALAKVEYNKETDVLQITGPTNSHQVVRAINDINEYKPNYIIMHGPGGEYFPGLSLGRTLRKTDSIVIIPKDKMCASACAFAAVGAKHLKVDGRLLFHKPYIRAIPFSSSFEEMAEKFGYGYVHMTYYLNDLGFHRSFVFAILNSSSMCKFIEVKNIEIKAPEDLKGWTIHDDCDRLKILESLQR